MFTFIYVYPIATKKKMHKFLMSLHEFIKFHIFLVAKENKQKLIEIKQPEWLKFLIHFITGGKYNGCYGETTFTCFFDWALRVQNSFLCNVAKSGGNFSLCITGYLVFHTSVDMCIPNKAKFSEFFKYLNLFCENFTIFPDISYKIRKKLPSPSQKIPQPKQL